VNVTAARPPDNEKVSRLRRALELVTILLKTSWQYFFLSRGI